jgi:hypothetical protein
MCSELLLAWVVYYLQPKYRMDARIVKAVVTGNIDLAKESLAASEINDLNRIFKVFGLKPYTLLDAAIAESKEVANAELKQNIQEIVTEMRRAGAKTYKELTNVSSGKPPFAVSRKRGRNLRGIALSRKNRRQLNNNGNNNNLGVTNRNLWHEGL